MKYFNSSLRDALQYFRRIPPSTGHKDYMYQAVYWVNLEGSYTTSDFIGGSEENIDSNKMNGVFNGIAVYYNTINDAPQVTTSSFNNITLAYDVFTGMSGWSVGAVGAMHVLLYPNPATTQLTVEGARGCSLMLTNALGQVVYTLAEAGLKQVVPLASLAPGIYTLAAVNAVTGERTCRMVEKR